MAGPSGVDLRDGDGRTLPALAVGLVAASVLAGVGAAAVIARLSQPADLGALATTALCAAIGASHEHRRAALARRLEHAERRATAAETAVGELTETAIALRDRGDHCATSLAFLAEVATRLDGRDPQAACEAALELAQARTGATGGVVKLRRTEGRLRTLAAAGPQDLRDLTADAAIARGAIVSVDEVPGARPEDSDLAAPILDEAGRVAGVLALRGVHYATLTAAVRAEIAGVAHWVERSLAASAVTANAAAAPAPGPRASGAYSYVWGKRHASS